MLHHNDPQVLCNVAMFLKDAHGQEVPGSRREGHNVWTLTGREYLAELMALQAVNPARVPVRSDRIYYVGVGAGAQAEVESVSALVTPSAYRAGEFLAPVQVPATFPADVSGTPRTAVRFIREYSTSEISLGVDVVLTEAGLFTDGDPFNNNTPPAPTGWAASSTRAPVAYHSFDPITKSSGFTFVVIWEVRIT